MSPEIENLIQESKAQQKRGDMLGALDLAIHAVELANDSPSVLPAALIQAANIHVSLGHFPDAQEMAMRVLANSTPDPNQVQSLIILGNCAGQTEDLPAAEEYFKQACNLSRMLGDKVGLSQALSRLAGNVYLYQGKFELALSTMEAAQVLKEPGDDSLWNLPFLRAYLFLLMGSQYFARQALDELVPFVKPNTLQSGWYFFLWARIALNDGLLDKADEYLRLGLKTANTIGSPDINIWIRNETSRYYRLAGNAPSAYQWANDAYQFGKRVRSQFFISQSLIERAQVQWDLGEIEKARQDLHDAYTIAETLQNNYLCAKAAFLVAVMDRNMDSSECENSLIEAGNLILRSGYTFILDQDRQDAFPMVASALRSSNHEARTIAEKLIKRLAEVPASPLRITGLGKFTVWQGRQTIPAKAWQRRKTGELFRYLLLQPLNSATRDQIIDALWTDTSATNSLSLFHQATSALRHALEPDLPDKFLSRYLKVDNEVIKLILPPGSTIDFIDFEREIPNALITKNYDLLRRYLSDYSGDLFPMDLYADWSVAPREHLTQLYRQGMLALAQWYLENNQALAALETSQKIIQQDPWNEEAVQITMLAYANMNNIPHAIYAYIQLEKTLQEELDLIPRADLRELAQALRQR